MELGYYSNVPKKRRWVTVVISKSFMWDAREISWGECVRWFEKLFRGYDPMPDLAIAEREQVALDRLAIVDWITPVIKRYHPPEKSS